MKVYRFRVMLVFVMYYIYVTSGPSLLIESTDSMILTYRMEVNPPVKSAEFEPNKDCPSSPQNVEVAR